MYKLSIPFGNQVEMLEYFLACIYLGNVSRIIFYFSVQNLFNDCFVELEQLTGIAAILRFPMPELEEDSEEEEEPN